MSVPFCWCHIFRIVFFLLSACSLLAPCVRALHSVMCGCEDVKHKKFYFIGTTKKKVTKCSKHCALKTRHRKIFNLQQFLALSLTWFVLCMRTSHAEEATAPSGVSKFLKKQKHSDYALRSQMTSYFVLYIPFFVYFLYDAKATNHPIDLHTQQYECRKFWKI